MAKKSLLSIIGLIILSFLLNHNFAISQVVTEQYINDVTGVWEDGKGNKVTIRSGINPEWNSLCIYVDWEYFEQIPGNSKNNCDRVKITEKNLLGNILFGEIKASIFERNCFCYYDKGTKKNIYQKVYFIETATGPNIPIISCYGSNGALTFDYINGYIMGGFYLEKPTPMKRVSKGEPVSNNQNENNNNNNNVSNSSVIINLYTQTNSSIFTSPGENSTCKLQADVDCSDKKAKSGRKVRMEFVSDKLGSFNTTEATTDADGKAYFTYTAPGDKALNGKNEVTIQVKATDVSSGEVSAISITILNRNTKSIFSAQSIIMPQGSQFYNELKIFINAPPKGDGYQATITTKDPLGLITGSKDNPGGESPAYIQIRPGQEYKYYYHNTGSIAHSQAVEEEVTLEIPELNFKQVINISVGVDLMVQSVERKWKGTIYPGLPEPLEVYIADNFHPGADLEKIFDDFDIKMRVRVEPSQISQEPVMSQYANDYISRFTTLFEGYMFGKNIVTSSGDAFVTIKKTNDGKYILCKETREALPFVMMFDRGMYEFSVELIDINYSEQLGNNSGTITFNVEQYRDETDEILKTALIPMSKVMIDFLTGGLMAYGDVVSATTDAIMYEGAIKDGKLIDAAVGLFGIICGSIEGSKQIKNIFTGALIPVTEKMKSTIKMVTLATNVQQIVGLIMNEKKGGGNKFAYKDISDKLKYPQSFIKGSKKHYLIIFDKSGIKNYSATLKNGNKLSLIAGKLLDNSTNEQRIDVNNDHIIIPCENEEEISLSLDFNGTGGFLYRVTKDKIEKIEYPKSSTSVKVNINSSNALAFGKQEGKQEDKKDDNKVTFAGSWETADFGTMTLIVSGTDLVGTCSKNIGIIKGTVSSDGTKITGVWSMFPTYSSPNDAGKFEITLSKDGKTFTGKWGKGTDDKAKMDKTLNGKKK